MVVKTEPPLFNGEVRGKRYFDLLKEKKRQEQTKMQFSMLM
jgi:hypothetical protein